MLERMPTEEEWNEWKAHPATKSLVKYMQQSRMQLMELWANGDFSAAFSVEMAVKNAGATGACSAYKELMELDYNQIVIGASDEEQVRPGAGGTSGAG